MSCRAVVLISGSGSNLQALIDASEAGDCPIEICAVISNKASAYGLERAANHSIDAHTVDHTAFDNRLEFDQALIQTIDQYQPDLVILAGFMRILTADFVNHYSDRLINIHPSLLPKYPGVNTHQRAIDAGDEWHGLSIHFVVPEVDAGPIILQGQIPIHDGENAGDLQQRIHKIEHILYPLAVKWFAQNRLTITEGSVLLDGEKSIKQLQSFA
jgi:phosphoribosylglycinamide formyltransferase-1